MTFVVAKCADAGDGHIYTIAKDGIIVGYAKPSKYGPGFYVKVTGVTWQNAPGARYPTELDARTDYTYAKTLKRVKEIVAAELAKQCTL